MSETKELRLPSRIESVDEAASQAETFVKDNGLGDDFVSAIDLAVRESVANAVKHGNKFDPEKEVEITFLRSPNGVEILVRDFGPGFDPEALPDPTDPANLLKANGRGILFMRTFMDEVEWASHDGGGMVVTMRKATVCMTNADLNKINRMGRIIFLGDQLLAVSELSRIRDFHK